MDTLFNIEDNKLVKKKVIFALPEEVSNKLEFLKFNRKLPKSTIIQLLIEQEFEKIIKASKN